MEMDWANLIETEGPKNTSVYRRPKINGNLCPLCLGPKAECWNDGTKDLDIPGSPWAKSADFTPQV